jgi:hypothetical protein
MPLLVDPAPTDEELAAIVAALAAAFESEADPAPASRSRWRASGRVYGDEAPDSR